MDPENKKMMGFISYLMQKLMDLYVTCCTGRLLQGARTNQAQTPESRSGVVNNNTDALVPIRADLDQK